MLIKQGDNFFFSGTVAKDAVLKRVGKGDYPLLQFSIVADKDEHDSPIFINIKAWYDLALLFSDIRKKDSIAGTGKLERQEYNGKVYTAIIADWLNCPMISTAVADKQDNTQQSSKPYKTNPLDEFEDLPI